MQRMPHQTHSGRLSNLLIGTGVFLIIISVFNLYPIIYISNILVDFDNSGMISVLMAHGQLWTGIALTAAGLLYILLSNNSLYALFESVIPLPSLSSLWIIAIIAGSTCYFVQHIVFEDIPHITDATSHVFQAKILASGQLSVPNPPCYDAFFQHNVIIGRNGLWHSKYFPGQALWLTPGFTLNAGWLMMPLGWGITVFSFGFLIRRFYSPFETYLATVLFGFSPLGLLLGASFMSHTTFLMYVLAAIALYFHYSSGPINRKEFGCLVIAGIMAGLALITRPQDCVPYFAGVVVIAAANYTQIWKYLKRTIIPITLGVLLPFLFLLHWNHVLYGSYFSSGYNFEGSLSLTPIIKDSIGFNDTHTPARALKYAALSLYRFEGSLTGWPITLLLILGYFFRRNFTSQDAACIAVSVSTIGLYLFFHYWGFELESRYYAPMIPAFILLTVRGLLGITNRVIDRNTNNGRRLAVAIVAGFSVFAIGHTVLFHLWHQYTNEYEQASMRPARTAEQLLSDHKGEELLILMESNEERDFVYSAGFAQNDPALKNAVIYARYIPGQMDCLRAAFPNRILYKMNPYDFSATLIAEPPD